MSGEIRIISKNGVCEWCKKKTVICATCERCLYCHMAEFHAEKRALEQ